VTAVVTGRFQLGTWPTPLGRLARLETALGIGALLAKRDDLAGFGLAGNKTRPLEYLIGAALAEEADVVVTGGRADSNFCPAAAAGPAAPGHEPVACRRRRAHARSGRR
jgi:1-aminocyclopropane-1-carboxylate deaminase/D-cysteine desulfhydrase-like pyridoxal-dependent ACC family enzyme